MIPEPAGDPFHRMVEPEVDECEPEFLFQGAGARGQDLFVYFREGLFPALIILGDVHQGREHPPAFVLEMDDLRFLTCIAVLFLKKADEQAGVLHHGFPAGEEGLLPFRKGDGIPA